MNTNDQFLRRCFHLCFAALTLAGSSLKAQIVPQTSNLNDQEVIRMNPFTVTDDADEGYTARSSTSGLGFAVETAKLPLAVTTLTPAFLADLGAVKVEDALRYVSGAANQGRSFKTESPTLRGFETNANLQDGELLSVPTDMAIIERIEVVKGPASIVYGVTDPAGVVNRVTKKPSFLKATSIATQWDEYGSMRATFDHNTPMYQSGELRAAGRFIVSRGQEKFHRPNEARYRTIVAPSFRFEYGRNSVLDVSFHRTEEGGRGNRIQIPWDRGAPPFTDPTIFAIGLVDVSRDFTFVTPNDDWEFRSKGVDLRWVQHLTDIFTLQVSYVDTTIDRVQYFNLGNGRLGQNAQGQYLAGNTLMVVEPANVTHRGFSAKLLGDFNTGNVNHKLTLGFRDNRDKNYEYAYYDNSVRADPVMQVIADTNGPREGVRFQGVPRTVFSLSDPNVLTLSGTTANTNPNAVYVRSLYITDYLTAMEGRLNVLVGASYLDIRTQKKSEFTPQAGAVYSLGRGVGVYGLYSRSAKENGPASTLNPALGFLEPETGQGMEVGLKFDPANSKLSGSAALFHIKRTNIVQFLGGGIFDQNNNIPSGEEIAKGFEVDLVYAPTPQLAVTFAYAYTDAYISKQELAVTPDYDGDGISDAVGLRKESVAKNDVRIWGSYAFTNDGPLGGLRLGGGLTWRQGPIQQFAGYIQRFIREEGDPTRLDLFAAYNTRAFGHDTRFQLNWNNVTNADYLDRRGYVVLPSTVTLSAEMKW